MKFKPCPFCGKTNFLLTPKDDYEDLVEEHGAACIGLYCRNCNADMYEHTDGVTYEEKLDLLKEKWNRRTK